MTKQEFISPIYLKNEELKKTTYHKFPEVYIIKEPLIQ